MTAARNVTATFSATLYTLTVTKAGTGTGTVISSPAGINCGVDCSQDYDHGTLVTLTPTPGVGQQFDGWSADCSGSGACVVTMDQARSVTATFSPIQRTICLLFFGPPANGGRPVDPSGSTKVVRNGALPSP